MNVTYDGFSFASFKWDFLAMLLAFFLLTLCTLALTMSRVRGMRRERRRAKVGVLNRKVIRIRRT